MIKDAIWTCELLRDPELFVRLRVSRDNVYIFYLDIRIAGYQFAYPLPAGSPSLLCNRHVPRRDNVRHEVHSLLLFSD